MEGESQDKAIAIFRYHAQIAENQQLWDKMPITYQINGVWFWIDTETGMVSIENPYLFDVRNPEHIEAIDIAQIIYMELASLRGILVYCEDGEINEDVFLRHGGFSEDAVFADWEYVQTILGNPYYQAAPRNYREKISAVIVKYAEYVMTFQKRRNEKRLEAMRTSSKYGYVYLIQSPTGSYKIGRTRDPKDRMKTFSVKLPFEVDYVCTIESADMYALERELHQKYASKRINGEWFMLEAADVAAIQGLAVSS